MVLVFIFALLNICLGFALAVYVGSGVAGFHEVWKALSGSRIRVASEPSIAASPSSSSPTAWSASHSNRMQAQPDSVKEDYLTNETNGANGVDYHTAELLEPSSPEDWELDETYVETSILRLNFAMMKSSSRANQIDSRLRECRDHSDPR